MRKTALKVIVVLAAIAAGLAIVEAALRIAGYGEWVPVIDVDDAAAQAISSGWLAEDRLLLWRINKCDPYCEAIRSVHPDNPRARPEPKSGKRVICLGDSCTFFGGRQGGPFSMQLEGLLHEAGGGAEVLNAAVPGYTSTQGLMWLKAELLAYKPDVVVVYFGWNDHYRTHAVPDSEYIESLRLSPFRIVRLLNSAFAGGGPAGPAEIAARPRRVPLDEYERNLKEIDRLVAGAGGASVFVTAPGIRRDRTHETQLRQQLIAEGDDYMALHRQYNLVVRGLAAEGFHVLDLAAAFRQHPDIASLMQDDGIHLSDNGVLLAAAALRDFILEHRLLE